MFIHDNGSNGEIMDCIHDGFDMEKNGYGVEWIMMDCVSSRDFHGIMKNNGYNDL